MILPCGRKGLGSHLVIGSSENAHAPARMELEVRVAGCWKASRVTTVVTSGPRYERDASGVDFFAFAVDSRLRQSLDDLRIIIILRDRAGEVIGGLAPRKPETPWPPGRSTQRVRMWELRVLPKTADTARLEAYVGNAEIDGQTA